MINTINLRRVPTEVEFEIQTRTAVGDRLGHLGVSETVVGVILQHQAVSTAPILSVQWHIDGFPNATVVNFDPTVQTGTFTNLAPQSLSATTINFGWWRPGTYTVTANIETPYGWGSTTQTFHVTAPLVRDFNGTTGSVAVGPYNGSTFLRLAESAQHFGTDGLHVQAIVAATQSIPGALAGIQLARNERFVTHLDGSNWRMVTNGTFILDVGMTGTVWYQNHAAPIGTNGQNVWWEANDGPGIELNSQSISAAYIGDGEPIVPEAYRLHLMFIANQAGAVWVPISLVEWTWGGYSTFKDGNWTPAADTTVSLSNPLDPSFPTWTQNTANPDWIPR